MPDSSWRRLCWNGVTKPRQGYGAIDKETTTIAAAVNVVKPNNKNCSRPQVQKKTSAENNKQPLDKIQNALFVTPREGDTPKKLPTSFVESESANFTTTTAPSRREVVAKSRPSSSSAASSCQRIRCKKLVRRFKKVIGETLKFTHDHDRSAVAEDIYVEVSGQVFFLVN